MVEFYNNDSGREKKKVQRANQAAQAAAAEPIKFTANGTVEKETIHTTIRIGIITSSSQTKE